MIAICKRISLCRGNNYTHTHTPLASAMTPGMMIRTSANTLMKVKVIWVREAMVTLQQLTATTNARGAQ